MSGTEPGDPFANPSWAPPPSEPTYPSTPPSSPGPFDAVAPPPPFSAPPPPPTPPPGRSKLPIVLAVLGVVALLGIVGFLAQGDDDPDTDTTAADDRDGDDDQTDDDQADDDETGDDADDTTTSSTETTAPSSTVPDLAELPDPGGPVVSSGSFALQLPAGWRGADLSAGTEGLGAELYPDDPTTAAAVQGQLDLMPRAILLMGFDVEGTSSSFGFASNVNVLVDPAAVAGTPMDQQLVQQQRGIGIVAEVADARVVDLGGREVGRIESVFGDGGGISYGVMSYLIDTGDEVVVLSYSFGTLDDANRRLADASAATFTAG